MRLNGFQRILIITAAVLAAVVSSLLIWHYDNNIWEYSLRNWCDDDLPLPQLVACVDGNYQSSRVGDGWKRVAARHYSRRPFPLQAAYREVKDFSPLKPKTYKVAFYNGKARLIVADRFEKLNLVMPQLAIPGLVIQTPRYPDKNNKCKMFMENVLVSKAFPNWKYPADRIYLSKDLLITKTGGKYKIYAASYEAVRLKGAKALFVVSVASFCPRGKFFDYCGTYYVYFTDTYSLRRDYVEEAELPAKYKTDKELFLNCPPYPRLINDVADESQPEKELVLSADRRVNPRSLYVKVNNRIFAIDISAKGEKGND